MKPTLEDYFRYISFDETLSAPSMTAVWRLVYLEIVESNALYFCLGIARTRRSKYEVLSLLAR